MPFTGTVTPVNPFPPDVPDPADIKVPPLILVAAPFKFKKEDEVRVSSPEPAVMAMLPATEKLGEMTDGVVMEVMKVGAVCSTLDPVPVKVVVPVPPLAVGKAPEMSRA